MSVGTRKRLAKLTSNIFNPFIVSLVVIMLLSFRVSASTAEALKWLLISTAFSVLPVFTAIFILVRSRRLESIFINARRQRHIIYAFSAACTVSGCAVLYSLGAPPVLLATFVAGLSSVVVFMCINLRWKISVHTAFVAASVTVLTILYGATGAATAVLVPLTGWSRIELERHSLPQVITGAVLAALISLVVFYSSGLI